MDTQSTSAAAKVTKDCVSEGAAKPLTFTAVDGLAFAAVKARLACLQSKKFVAVDIGPLLELMHLSSDGLLPPLHDARWIAFSETADFFEAVQKNRRYWICPATRQLGFLRAIGEHDESIWLRFVSAAQQAAVGAGFAKQVARQFVAALGEMLDNIYQHSKLSETGLAAFNARNGHFEFVIADRGIGILKSLKENSEYEYLSDHGDALQLALTDGCSKYGSNSNHGHGFRPLFIGLSNLNGSLRFRSGDHALTIDGRNPQSIPWTKVAKPQISGFLAAISCQRA